MKISGLIPVFRTVFSKDEAFERILFYVLHGILKDGSRISCYNFLRKSSASYILRDVPVSSLHSDTRFFTLMGEDSLKVSCFRTFVAAMQKQAPSFGKGCYVDSTPFPNDIDNDSFNALCSHGVSYSEIMTQLILVLDEAAGLSVWYDISPGNVLDITTVMTIINDVADTLNIESDSLVLDAGYIYKGLIGGFPHRDGKDHHRKDAGPERLSFQKTFLKQQRNIWNCFRCPNGRISRYTEKY